MLLPLNHDPENTKHLQILGIFIYILIADISFHTKKHVKHQPKSTTLSAPLAPSKQQYQPGDQVKCLCPTVPSLTAGVQHPLNSNAIQFSASMHRLLLFWKHSQKPGQRWGTSSLWSLWDSPWVSPPCWPCSVSSSRACFRLECILELQQYILHASGEM